MTREGGPDDSMLAVAGLGCALVATAVATGALLEDGDAELLVAIGLGLASLILAIAPGLGVPPRKLGLALTALWTIGGPVLVGLTHGLSRPHVFLVCMGPLIALAFVGRREAAAAGGVSLGVAFAQFGVRLVTDSGESGPALRAELDGAIGLLLASAVLILAYAAASLRSRVIARTREAVRSSGRWLEAFPDAMLRLDGHGLVLDARWSSSLVPPTEWRGSYIGNLFPEMRGLVRTLVRGARQGVEVLDCRLERNPPVDLEIRGVSDGQDGLILFVRDVSREREKERAEREAERERGRGAIESQVLQAGRLAHMGVLATGVAHEINNPLAYIMNNLEFLERGLDANEPKENLREAVIDAADGARRIRSIVEDIRVFARSDDSDHLELVEPAEVAAAAVRLLRVELRQRVRLAEEHAAAPPVFANPSRLTQVVMNLLVNAIQAIPADRTYPGTIVLRTGTTPTGEAFVEVADDGVGISEEHRRRVFEPFFTTRPIGEGSGLGLSICYGLVRRLGGAVDVESEVGRGSTFRIRLPNGAGLLDA